MASTPSNNRLKLTPSNSPFVHRMPRSPFRTRAFNDAANAASSSSASASSRLSLKRVVGSTCCSPTGFDTVNSSFAYIAGGAVVVVDVYGDYYRQRFYRARPTAVPVYCISPLPQGPSTPTSTPKANDSRNRLAAGAGRRDSTYGLPDWSSESPTSGKTWTQRERIKSATCLALSRHGRFLAVGETGYAPRVLIFNLDDSSSDRPLVSISEHSFGVTAVAWSADSRYLASLGEANDGFLYIWRIDPRTGSAKLFQQNRCTSYVRGMTWLGNTTLITYGVRHVKVWRVDDGSGASTSPTKPRHANDNCMSTPPPLNNNQPKDHQRTLAGRNILLGSLLEATFSCAASLPSGGRAVICSEAGDICLVESTSKQMKLACVRDAGFPVSCVSVRNGRIYFGSKTGHAMAMDVDDFLLEGRRIAQQMQLASSSSTASLSTSSLGHGRKGSVSTPSVSSHPSPSVRPGLVAMGFLTGHVVTIDTKQSIDIFSSLDHVPGEEPAPHVTRIPIPGHGEPIMGIQALTMPNDLNAAFLTWSSSGNILLWNVDGEVQSSLQVPLEQTPTGDELDPVNQLSAVQAAAGGKIIVTADRCGVLRIMDYATRAFILETKAHASPCQSISIYEQGARLLIATCGRDRTAQLFHRLRDGTVAHFQTLEFAARAVQVLISPDDKIITCSFDRTLQVYDLVSKEDEPDVLAAIPSRVMTLKASPTSMVLAPDARTIFVSLLDRTICQYDLTTNRLVSSFKCLDEGGSESALLDSLIYGTQPTGAAAGTTYLQSPSPTTTTTSAAETSFILGLSNTDKSVRIYDANTGAFLDREWGHTEAINGVALIDSNGDDDDDDNISGGGGNSLTKRPCSTSFSGGCRKVVSVGSDGTIMFWSLDLRDRPMLGSSPSRDPSPVKDANSQGAASRPPLRRVLSKAEFAEFQRPSTAGGSGGGVGGSGATGSSNPNGRRSPSRVLNRRASRYNLTVGAGPSPRPPISLLLNTPAPAIAENGSSSRRASGGSGSGSPPAPASPKPKIRRRPSLPAIGTTPTSSGSKNSGNNGGSSNSNNGNSGNNNNNSNAKNNNDVSPSVSTVRKKGSASSLRSAYGFGSLSMATEQTSRQLRAYRKRLTSTDSISQEVLDELDQELRLTLAALGDRVTRSKAMSEQLDGMIDEKLERLVTMLDKKFSIRRDRGRGDAKSRARDKASPRPRERERERERDRHPDRHPDRDRDGDRERERDFSRHKSTVSGSTDTSNATVGGSGSGSDDDRGDSNSADMDNTSPDENSRPASKAGSVRE